MYMMNLSIDHTVVERFSYNPAGLVHEYVYRNELFQISFTI